ncbi:MAG: hypothetical protein ACR2OH_00685 [Microthrixaceae bacterium]
MEDHPPPGPARLLSDWMDGERGEHQPGRVLSNLNTHAMRDFLESRAGATPESDPT